MVGYIYVHLQKAQRWLQLIQIWTGPEIHNVVKTHPRCSALLLRCLRQEVSLHQQPCYSCGIWRPFPLLIGRSKAPGFLGRLRFAEAVSSQALHSCCPSLSALLGCLQETQPVCLSKKRDYTKSSNFCGSYFLLIADESLVISTCVLEVLNTMFFIALSS